MRTLKLITRFYVYGGIFLTNFLVSLICIYFITYFGNKAVEIIGILFWFKITTVCIIFYTVIYYHPNELIYYQNLGISKLRLFFSTSIAEFLLSLVLIVFQLKVAINGTAFNALLWSVLLLYLFIYIKK